LSIPDTENRHDSGIDLVKIVSMVFIAVLHVLGQGGVLNACRPLSARYETAWLFEIAAYGAVNCFALASGYLLSFRPFKAVRIIELWLQVVFYTVLITYIFSKVRPAAVTGETWRNAFLPVIKNQYWYFTAYAGIFFLIPFFNYAVEVMCRRQLFLLFAALFIVFSVIPTFSQRDIFGTDNGYSAVWLALLYLAGACIRKYRLEDKSNVFVCLFLYLCCVLLVWFCKRCLDLHPVTVSGVKIKSGIFVNYTSPLIVLDSVALFLALSKLNVKSRLVSGVLAFLAPLAFSVYLIHANPLVWEHILKLRYEKYAKLRPVFLALHTAGTALLIWFVCSLADLPRFWLFRLVKTAFRAGRKHCKQST
jgi:hypothetical protein